MVGSIEAIFSVVKKDGRCESSMCPQVLETNLTDEHGRELLGVQGTQVEREDAPEGMPEHEGVVLISKEVYLQGAAEMMRQDRPELAAEVDLYIKTALAVGSVAAGGSEANVSAIDESVPFSPIVVDQMGNA